MKSKILMLIVAGLMISFTACSQSPQRGPGQGGRGNFTPEDMAKRQTEMVKEAAGLDDATTKKVEVIMLKYAKKMSEMRQAGQPGEGMREQFQKIREEQNAELKTVLTEEQFAKYQAKQEEMRRNRQGGGPGGPR